MSGNDSTSFVGLFFTVMGCLFVALIVLLVVGFFALDAGCFGRLN